MTILPFLPKFVRNWWACRLLNEMHRCDSRIRKVQRVMEGIDLEYEYTEGFRGHLERELKAAVLRRETIVKRLNRL